jgi:hypothetical protein
LEAINIPNQRHPIQLKSVWWFNFYERNSICASFGRLYPFERRQGFGVFRVTLKIKLPLYSVHLAGRGKKQTGDKKKSG